MNTAYSQSTCFVDCEYAILYFNKNQLVLACKYNYYWLEFMVYYIYPQI